MKKILILIWIILFIFISIKLSAAEDNVALQILASSSGKSLSSDYINNGYSGAIIAGVYSDSSFYFTSNIDVAVLSANSSISITDIKIDGKNLASGDYINKDGLLTVAISSESNLDLNLSSIEVDGALMAFSSLTLPSSYDASSKILYFKLNILSDGDHTISVHIVDVFGNLSSSSYLVKTNSTSVSTSSVFVFPNPFNPYRGSAKIAYQLSKDADTLVFIFNSIGQLIYRKNYVSGTTGAQTGYNEVSWDGVSDFGQVVGNDIYFVRIVSENKVVGRSKIAVIK